MHEDRSPEHPADTAERQLLPWTPPKLNRLDIHGTFKGTASQELPTFYPSGVTS
jgi:hypothetical protein